MSSTASIISASRTAAATILGGVLDAAILAELEAAPRSGWRFAAAYRALRRLERDGLVASTPKRGSERGRRLYRLTSDGEEALAAYVLARRM